MQARTYSAYWTMNYFCNFFIREPLNVTEYEDIPKRIIERFNGASNLVIEYFVVLLFHKIFMIEGCLL